MSASERARLYRARKRVREDRAKKTAEGRSAMPHCAGCARLLAKLDRIRLLLELP
jgi:hypothetical protein